MHNQTPLLSTHDLFVAPPMSPQTLLTSVSSDLKDHHQQWKQCLQTLLEQHPEPYWQQSISAWIHDNIPTWMSFVQYLCQQIFSTAHATPALPAHDIRHALLKTPLRAIEHIRAIDPTATQDSYLTLGLLATVCHDWGRWAEERVLHECGTGMLHGRLSATLVLYTISQWQKNNLTQLPIDIKYFLLNAIADHSAGASYSDTLPLQIVVRADRDQLYGPEIILRNIHHCPQSNGSEHHYIFPHPHFPSSTPTFYKLNKFNTTRLQGPLHLLDSSLRCREAILERFLLLTALDDHALEQVHVDRHPSLNQKKQLQQLLLEQIQFPSTSLNDTIIQLISRPGCASHPKYTDWAIKKFIGLNAPYRLKVNKALTQVLAEQATQDTSDNLSIASALDQYRSNSATHLIASLIQKELACP